MQIVHCLDRQEDCEIELGLFFSVREAKFELATAIDHLLEELVDRVLISSGAGRHQTPYLLADAVQEARGARIFGKLGRVRKEAPEIDIVKLFCRVKAVTL